MNHPEEPSEEEEEGLCFLFQLVTWTSLPERRKLAEQEDVLHHFLFLTF